MAYDNQMILASLWRVKVSKFERKFEWAQKSIDYEISETLKLYILFS